MSIRSYWVVSTALIAGCVTASSHSYKLYPGPALPEAELAVVEIAAGLDHTEIDGLSVYPADYGRVLVSPGKHSIVLIGPEGISLRYTAILEKGHQYRLLTWWGRLCYWCAQPEFSGKTVWGWVEDETSGLVVGELDGNAATK